MIETCPFDDSDLAGGQVWHSSSASVSMRVGCVDGPGLHRPSAKQSVDHRSKQVDPSSDVEDSLPFFYGVLKSEQIVMSTET